MQSPNGIRAANGTRSCSMPGLRCSSKSHLFSSWIGFQRQGLLSNGQRMKPILDPASSMRAFYFDKQDNRVVFGDIRENETHLLTNGQTITIKPDQVMDFKNLPYEDESFQCVIFDPPHLLGLSEKSWMRKKYGVLEQSTWQQDLTDGFKECFRVLKSNGTLIFKWNETSIKLKEILALTDQKPVLGHPSGKRMGTHWVLFIK